MRSDEIAFFVHQTRAKERAMSETNEVTYHVPFTTDSSLASGLRVSAALGGGPPHAFLLDTGSVGILAPRSVLGPDYQQFDPSLDIEFEYASSGKKYFGQWVNVPVVLGVPAGWDGTGDYPIAEVEVFAVDRAIDQPADWNGGVFGVGFAIGGRADGGPARNPLLNMSYQGAQLGPGYIVTAQGVDAGLTSANTAGFAFIALELDDSGVDWSQPYGSVALSGDFNPDGFYADLPILVDTGIDHMILWLGDDDAPPNLAPGTAFPAGVSVTLSAPPADLGDPPVLQYSFVTGDGSQPMAPSWVEWRDGNGINTGRNVLAGADYLYDAAGGRVGFRVPAA
jgi:hypothetical protein